jgi:hypothetical protein
MKNLSIIKIKNNKENIDIIKKNKFLEKLNISFEAKEVT